MSSIYSIEYQSLIALLKQTRIERRITQRALAEALGKPHSFVPKYENGERRLDMVEFVHIARLIGLDLNLAFSQIKEDAGPLPESRIYGYRANSD